MTGIRTGDLVLTKDALCQLSYIGGLLFLGGFAPPDPPRRSLAGAPDSPLRSRGSLARARSLRSIATATAKQALQSTRFPAPARVSAPAGAARGVGAPQATARGGSAGRSPPTKKWSGRRGSNPRPTAWKAVTLPLSYSRLRSLPLARSLAAPAGKPAFAQPLSLYLRRRPSPWPASRSSRSGSRRARAKVVAREGFEPSKPLGRQIYSLLRLTASLPRRISTALGSAPVRQATRPLDSRNPH